MDGDTRLVPVGPDLGAFHDGAGGHCQQVRVAAHGTPESDGVVTELLARQLVAALARVPADGRVAFAEAHRLEPLLLGLGNSAEYPDTYAVGPSGIPPVAMLDSGSYELWQWAAVTQSLWQACEVRAKVGAGLGDPTSAADLLDDVLGDLRPLLANSCGYLDVVRRG